MPGLRLDATPFSVPKFAVVAKYVRPNGGDSFVEHVAILRDEATLAFDGRVEVWHTCPPTVAGQQTIEASQEKYHSCPVHAVAFLDDLSADEAAGIETTLEEIDAQTPRALKRIEHYYVNPPVKTEFDKITGIVRFRKFSCVGFILECYNEGANIQLLGSDYSSFPPVALDILMSAYGNIVTNEKTRELLGISGAPPWRIALAGYVLHSLNRQAADVRMTAHLPAGIHEASFPNP